MRRRPLCIVFLTLVLFIFTAKAAGIPLWGMPDKELRSLAGELSGRNCVIYGTVDSREEKTNSISYFLKDSFLLTNTAFKDASLDSVKDAGPDSVRENDPVSLHNIQLYISKEEPHIKIGSRIVIFGKPQLYENASNPGGFDAEDYYAADDCCLSVYTDEFRVLSEPGFSMRESFTVMKEDMRGALKSMMSESSAAVICAMLFGDSTELTGDIKLDYSAAGITHILSISGMHVAVIGGFVYKMLLFLRCRLKASSLISVIVIAFYCIFTGSSDSTIRSFIMFAVLNLGRCTLRSYDQMSALSFAGILMLSFRPMSLFRAGFQLSFAAVIGMACVSSAIRQKYKERLNRAGKIKRAVLSSLITWFGVNLVTFPIVLYHFFEFPVYSLISNIIFVPLMGIVMILGLAGCAFVFWIPPLAKILLFIPDAILAAQNTAGSFILKLPYSTIIIGRPELWQIAAAFVGIIIFTYNIKGKIASAYFKNRRTYGSLNKRKLSGSYKNSRVYELSKKGRVYESYNSERASDSYGRAKILAALLAAVFLPVLRLPQGFSITALDVGQGDCLFIRSGSLVYMVDGGSSSNGSVGEYSIIPYIKSEGISTVEGIFLTHDDTDHMSGIAELFEMIEQKKTAIRVNKFFVPCWMKEETYEDKTYSAERYTKRNEADNAESEDNETAKQAAGTEYSEIETIIDSAENAGAEVYYLQTGDTIQSGELYIEVLGPDVDSALEGNEGSLVISAEYCDFSALLTGDLEGDGEQNLMGKSGRYDYLKVPHHGSRNSGSVEFYREISPVISIISAPEDSIYGHPHPETIELIEACGSDWLQTGISGAIRVEVRDTKIYVKTFRAD